MKRLVAFILFAPLCLVTLLAAFAITLVCWAGSESREDFGINLDKALDVACAPLKWSFIQVWGK